MSGIDVMMNMKADYREVLKFWFTELTPEQWFKMDAEVDDRIGRDFGGLLDRASRCELYERRREPAGRLAEIIVLDQFSRNIYRNSGEAFANDPLSLALAQEAVALGVDQELEPTERAFMYMPYMHSESALIHEVAMSLFAQEGLEYNLKFEIQHRDIILQFGRYPHRNQLLGRESSEEELAFLQSAGSGF